MKYVKYLAILPLVFVLSLVAGCTNTVSSDVARFHRMPAPSGESFVIEPMDQAKVNSLEFGQYANMVGDKLVALGYRTTPIGQKPALIVKLDYAVSSGQVRIRSYPGMGYYGMYPYGRYWGPYYYDPFYPYGYGFESEIRSEVYYTRFLRMDIERPAAEPGKLPEKLFEGRVESEGRDNRLPEIMPYLIKALFDKFPGPSGVTQHIDIKKEKGSENY